MSQNSNLLCSQCAHRNPPASRFCNQCGSALEAVEEHSHYTPRHLSEKILRSRSAMEGERKQVTVMFVDVKDSVALSRIVDAEQWHRILDRFFALLSEQVHRFEGTINQYTGDGIMALFGAPIAHEDHAERACRAALGIQQGMAELAARWKAEFGIRFQLRLGLNSGEVIVGRIGDDLRMDYTAKGQTVGLASRMEELASPDHILVSAYTRDLLGSEFELKEAGAVSVKGFKRKIHSYELKGVSRGEDRIREDTLPLIGRERELRLLNAYCSQVSKQESGLLVVMSADTGLGKSRLCREFMQRCRQAGMPVISIHGSSHHRADPLAAVRELFISYFELDCEQPAEALQAQVMAGLEAFLPLPPMLLDNLLQILGLAGDAVELVEDPGLQVELAQKLILRLMHDGILQQRQLFVIENIHWLDDPQTRDLFEALLAMLPHLPVLVLVTARSDYELPWEPQPIMRHMNLRPLSDADSQQFLDVLLGNDPQLEELRSAIVERAGGNPMFLTEVVEQLLSTGVLERDAKSVRLKKNTLEISLPPSVQAVVAARIDTLPEQSKRLLQAAAVLGRRVPLGLLREVFGPDGFDSALQELLRQGFLHRDVGPENRAALLFSQSLFQVVGYDALLSAQRKKWHQRVAEAMSRQPRQDAVLLAQRARHHAEAGQLEQAVIAYLRSAETGARTDMTDAIRRLDKARAVLERAGKGELHELRLRVLSRWMQFAARSGLDPERLQACMQEARTLDSDEIALEVRVLYLVSQGSVALADARPSDALHSFEAARGLANERSDASMQLLACVPLVYGLVTCGRLVEALQQAEIGLALCAEDPQLGRAGMSYSPLVALLALKSWISILLGQAAQAVEIAEEALRLARVQAHGEQIVAAEASLAYALAESGSSDLATHEAGRALQVAQSMKNRAVEMMALMAYARSLLQADQPSEAIVVLEDALGQLGKLAFGQGERARLQADLSLAQLLAGNPRAAREAGAAAVKDAEAAGADLALIEALLAQIRAGLFSTRPWSFLKRYQAPMQRCAELVERCDARLRRPELLLLQARWHQLREQPEEAVRCREQAQSLIEEHGLAQPLTSRLDKN